MLLFSILNTNRLFNIYVRFGANLVFYLYRDSSMMKNIQGFIIAPFLLIEERQLSDRTHFKNWQTSLEACYAS